MSAIKRWLQKIGIGKKAEEISASEAEALRTAFKTRYHNFKLLLAANNKALQIMSEIGGGPERGQALWHVLCPV